MNKWALYSSLIIGTLALVFSSLFLDLSPVFLWVFPFQQALLLGNSIFAAGLLIGANIVFTVTIFGLVNYLLQKNKLIYLIIPAIAVILIIASTLILFAESSRCSGFCPASIDSRRVSDLYLIQAYLEGYNNLSGHYPGTCSGGTESAPNSWVKISSPGGCDNSSLTDVLYNSIGVELPDDPLASSQNKHYVYSVNDSLTKYIIGADLENPNSILDSKVNITSGIPYVHRTGDSGVDCKYASGGKNLSFCISSKFQYKEE